MNPPPPPPPPQVQNTASLFDDKNVQSQIFRTEATKTRNIIFSVAALLFLGDIIALAIAGVMTGELVLAALLFPVIFMILGFVAPKQPLIAIIISLIVFVIILVLSFAAYGSRGLVGGIFIKIIIVAGLIGGLTTANKAEKAKRLMR